VIDFEDKFFVAMYDEQYASSTMFEIGAVSTSPAYANVVNTDAVADTVLSYHTDYTSNFLQLSTTSATVSSVNLYFVDNYLSASQHAYAYATPASPGSYDSQLLIDLNTTGTIKVSFSLVIDG
jgi:hypothetical protein